MVLSNADSYANCILHYYVLQINGVHSAIIQKTIPALDHIMIVLFLTSYVLFAPQS